MPPSTAAPESVFDWRRALALGVDLALALAASLLLSLISPNAPWLALAYVLLKDLPCRGRSVGKLLLKLEVVARGGEACGPGQAVLRNVTLLPPVLLVELLVAAFSDDRRRLGDVLAGTRVQRVAPCGVGSDAQPSVRPEPAAPATSPAPAPARPMPPIGRTAPPPAIPPMDSSPPTPTPPRIPSLDTQPTPAADSADTPSPPALRAPRAHEILGIGPDADEDAVEDAYWAFVDVYSDDALKGLPEDELEARCQRLRERFAGCDLSSFTTPMPCAPAMPVERKREFIKQFVIAVNAARDQMLG